MTGGVDLEVTTVKRHLQKKALSVFARCKLITYISHDIAIGNLGMEVSPTHSTTPIPSHTLNTST
jgi:hypothetical protein